nr:putative ribonuclease H-like domain-containing protein [Tanacetum cinerariifolium]
MTGNRALLTNFVEKFLGTVCFGNNDFEVIAGYGDVVIGSMTIEKVYYVEGLGHNLFIVGQFCENGLEVAFRKSTCFVRNEDGVDLLTGDRSLNLYTVALNEVALNSSTCLLAKASSSQSLLWHQHLFHLNFTTINNLMKNNLVQCLPKMKFEKDHLCSACEQGKIHRKHHKFKTAFDSKKPLYLLHMDLCGPMRVENEASEVIISFIKKTQHMTGNRALLTNFVEKFLGTVRFGNNDFGVIAGYGDVVIGSMTIKKVYYVEGLGHNLFSVGQFCDKGFEVAFQKSTCFVLNEDGVDLLIGDRSSNLYTNALNEVASNSSTCLLEKSSSS